MLVIDVDPTEDHLFTLVRGARRERAFQKAGDGFRAVAFGRSARVHPCGTLTADYQCSGNRSDYTQKRLSTTSEFSETVIDCAIALTTLPAAGESCARVLRAVVCAATANS
jgi:hypothetical protein